jgi:hypothetical protein
MILTEGDPSGATRNNVAGIDFQYRNTRLRGKQITADVQALRSHSSRVGNDQLYGASVSFQADPWSISVRANEVGKNFLPALGFVNRPAIRDYNGNVGRVWRWRGGPIQSMQANGNLSRTTGLDNRLQSSSSIARLQLTTRRTDEYSVMYKANTEVIAAPFTLPGNIIVSAGRYTWVRPQARYESPSGKPLIINLEYECCAYYNGRLARTALSAEYHPNATFGASLSESWQKISLPGGGVTIRIDSLETQLNFTTTHALRGQFQYDNISRRFAASLRYKWQVSPRTDLLAVLGETALLRETISNASYHSQGSAFIVRLGHRLQY